MLDRVLRFFITLFLAIAGGALLDLASPVLTMYVGTEILKMEMGIVRITMGSLICILLGAVLGGLIGFLASPYFIRCLKRFSAWVEQQLGKMPIHDVIAGAIGLAIGLIIANLLGYSFEITSPSSSASSLVISASPSRSRSARNSRGSLTSCRAS